MNYRHLLYFWQVAREGSFTRAAEKLHVSQPSVSAQVRKLEQALGQELLDRTGKDLSLTAEGRIAWEYADDIFRLGRELRETLDGGLGGRPMRLVVGVTHSIPKLVAFHLLSPAFQLEYPVRLVVREERTDRLLSELATGDVDLVLSDVPVAPNASVRAHSHLLGESSVSVFAPARQAPAVRKGFPRSLDGRRFLLPTDGFTLRRSLEVWFSDLDLHPAPIAEIEDGALIKAFAEAGLGFFAAPTVVAADVCEKYGVEVVGEASGVTERFYAITRDKEVRHPAAAAIRATAWSQLVDHAATT